MTEAEWLEGRDLAAMVDEVRRRGRPLEARLLTASRRLGQRGWVGLDVMLPFARQRVQDKLPAIQPYNLAVDLVREIVGNPFRPPAVFPEEVPTLILDLARAARKSKQLYGPLGLDFGLLENDRLLVLADAMEEEGWVEPCRWCVRGKIDPLRTGHPFPCHACDRTGWRTHCFITHCREEVQHVRGCWVLDALLADEGPGE